MQALRGARPHLPQDHQFASQKCPLEPHSRPFEKGAHWRPEAQETHQSRGVQARSQQDTWALLEDMFDKKHQQTEQDAETSALY